MILDPLARHCSIHQISSVHHITEKAMCPCLTRSSLCTAHPGILYRLPPHRSCTYPCSNPSGESHWPHRFLYDLPGHLQWPHHSFPHLHQCMPAFALLPTPSSASSPLVVAVMPTAAASVASMPLCSSPSASPTLCAASSLCRPYEECKVSSRLLQQPHHQLIQQPLHASLPTSATSTPASSAATASAPSVDPHCSPVTAATSCLSLYPLQCVSATIQVSSIF